MATTRYYLHAAPVSGSGRRRLAEGSGVIVRDLSPFEGEGSAGSPYTKTVYLQGAPACAQLRGSALQQRHRLAPLPLLQCTAGGAARAAARCLNTQRLPGPSRAPARAGHDYTFSLESRNAYCAEGEVLQADAATYTVPASTKPTVSGAAGSATKAVLSVVAPEGVDPATLTGQYKLYVVDPSSGATLRDLGVVTPTNAGTVGAGTWDVPLTFEVPLSTFPGAGQPGYYQASKAAWGWRGVRALWLSQPWEGECARARPPASGLHPVQLGCLRCVHAPHPTACPASPRPTLLPLCRPSSRLPPCAPTALASC